MKPLSGPHLSFPFRISANGKVAQVISHEQHVKEELLQILLTQMGERVFLSRFGGGVKGLLFENVDAASFAMTKAHITDAIGRWLGHRIILEDLQVESHPHLESGVDILIVYRLFEQKETRILRLQTQGEVL